MVVVFVFIAAQQFCQTALLAKASLDSLFAKIQQLASNEQINYPPLSIPHSGIFRTDRKRDTRGHSRLKQPRPMKKVVHTEIIFEFRLHSPFAMQCYVWDALPLEL